MYHRCKYTQSNLKFCVFYSQDIENCTFCQVMRWWTDKGLACCSWAHVEFSSSSSWNRSPSNPMGRLAAVRRPPASGAVIFYGRPTATSNATPISKTNPSAQHDSDSETSSSAQSLSSIDSDTSSSTVVEKETTSDEIIKVQHTGQSHRRSFFLKI